MANFSKSVLGINANKIPTMKETISNYILGINNVLDDLQSISNKNSFTGEYAECVDNYVLTVNKVCKYFTNNLLKFADKLDQIKLAYEQKDLQMSEEIINGTNNLETTNSNTGEGINHVLSSVASTAFVGFSSILSGAGGAIEQLVDGTASIVATTIITPFVGIYDVFKGTNYTSQMIDAVYDFTRRDLVGEANQYFYENTEIGKKINSNSSMKYDSEAAQTISTVSEYATKIGIAAATTYFGGPYLSLAVGGIYGYGGGIENYTQSVNREAGESYNYGKAFAKGGVNALAGAAEFYGYGQMTKGLIETGKALSAAGGGISGVKTAISNMIPKSGVDTKLFAKNFAKNLVDIDNVTESAAVVSDHVVNFAYGDETAEQAFKNGVSELGVAFMLNAPGSALGALSSSAKVVTNDLLDSDVSYRAGSNFNTKNPKSQVFSESVKLSMVEKTASGEYYEAIVKGKDLSKVFDDEVKYIMSSEGTEYIFDNDLKEAKIIRQHLLVSKNKIYEDMINTGAKVGRANAVTAVEIMLEESDYNLDVSQVKTFLKTNGSSVTGASISSTPIRNMVKIDETRKWAVNKMPSMIEKELGVWTDHEKVAKVTETMVFGEKYFKDKPNTLGYYDPKTNKVYINPNQSASQMKATVVHESMHYISEGPKKGGIELENSIKTDYGSTSLVGANECLTEYITKNITPQSESGYDGGVHVIKKLVKNGVFTNEEIKVAYITNDLSVLDEKVVTISGGKEMFSANGVLFDVMTGKQAAGVTISDSEARRQMSKFVNRLISYAN